MPTAHCQIASLSQRRRPVRLWFGALASRGLISLNKLPVLDFVLAYIPCAPARPPPRPRHPAPTPPAPLAADIVLAVASCLLIIHWHNTVATVERIARQRRLPRLPLLLIAYYCLEFAVGVVMYNWRGLICLFTQVSVRGPCRSHAPRRLTPSQLPLDSVSAACVGTLFVLTGRRVQRLTDSMCVCPRASVAARARSPQPAPEPGWPQTLAPSRTVGTLGPSSASLTSWPAARS